MPQLAIVEDNLDQQRNLADAFARYGFDVRTYADRPTAYAGIVARPPDLAILDIRLGSEEDAGFNLCRDLREHLPKLRLIFLTDRVGEADQIEGLQLGAWDYQTKPISLPVLRARVNNVLRVREDAHGEIRRIGELTCNVARNQVTWQGQAVPLTVTECRFIDTITALQGGVATYDELAGVTGQTIVQDNTITTHIRNIRRKFRAIDASFDRIKNQVGKGYSWKTP